MSETSTGAPDFGWADDPAVVMFCVTCIDGIQPARVLELLSADAHPDGLVNAMQVDTAAARQGTTGVRVASAGQWSILIEFTSLHGAAPDTVVTLSADTRVVSLHRTGSGEARLIVAENGVEVTSFEPAIPRFRAGSEPDRYLAAMREAGFAPDDGDATSGETDALELIRRLFGIAVTTTMGFDSRWPAGHLRR